MQHNKLFVGIDIASTDFVATFMDSDGHILISKPPRFSNDLSGASALLNTTLQLIEKYHYDSVSFGMESTSNYHFHLSNFLATNPALSS